MPVTRVGVMIGSPGDAAEERQAITEAILQWNAVYGRGQKVLLEPVKWETHATPGLLGRPQGMINQELIPQSDCLVAVFHARAGSHTGVEVSGTIEEVKQFLSTGKHVAVYFYTGPVLIGKVDEEQLKTLRNFQKEVRKEGLTGEYSSVEELKTQLLVHLGSFVARVLPGISDDSPPPPAKTSRPKPPAAAKKATKKAPAKGGKPEPTPVVVDDSADWGFLDNRFYQFKAVDRPDDRHFVVELITADAQAEAALEGLRPQQYAKGKPVAFAYANDAFVVRSDAVKSSYQGKEHKWTITLVKEDVEYGGGMMEMAYTSEGRHYTADEIAELRARRILLGDPPPAKPNRSAADFLASNGMLETFIQGVNTPLRVVESPIQALATSMPLDDPALFLRLARLVSMFHLKAGGVVERIERLALGPVKGGSVHVTFRGLRRKKYSNTPAPVIEVEGDCALPAAK